MAGRRRHFGSVRKRASGRYEASYWHLGTRHIGPGTFKSKADGQAWLSTVEADILRETWVAPTAGRQTLKAYADSWLKTRSDLRPTTAAKYRYLLDSHIYPELGSVTVSGLSSSSVRSWYHALTARHRSVGDDAYRLLRAVMNTAVDDKIRAASPCTTKGAGRVQSPERPIASVDEVARAVAAAPERYRLALLFTAWCQLRRGEVLALQRRHVNLLHRSIRIEQAWVQPHTGRPTLGPPKSEAGCRTLSIPPNVISVVEDHLTRFVGGDPEAWLFTSANGEPLSPRQANRVWDSARKTIGRPDLHFHDLRHSGLTWAAASGASLSELMRRGGQSTAAAALVYQHATDERDRSLADALGAMAKPQAKKKGSSKGSSRPERAQST